MLVYHMPVTQNGKLTSTFYLGNEGASFRVDIVSNESHIVCEFIGLAETSYVFHLRPL